jgi:hypothetical protein
MIQKITKTASLKDVYFEDIDGFVASKDVAYLVQSFYFFYFSTPEAAQEKAKKLGLSEAIVDAQ